MKQNTEKKQPSWMNELANVAEKTTFASVSPALEEQKHQDEGKIFAFSTTEQEGGALVDVRAEISIEKHNAVQGNYRIPRALKERMQNVIRGSMSVGLIALAEMALESLEKEHKTLIVKNK